MNSARRGGAVFRSPLHIEHGQAPIAASASTGPTHRLPFPSIVANDVTSYVEQVLALADRRGSRFVDPGAPLSDQPSNRSSTGTAAEERLLVYLALLDPRVSPAYEPAVASSATLAPVRSI